MLNWFKKIFEGKDVKSEFQEITKKSIDDVNVVYSLDIQKQFNIEYHKITSTVSSIDLFKKQVQDLVVKNSRKTEYKNEVAFMNEISVFVYYLFLIIEDNYNYGDKTLRENLTNFDDYLIQNSRQESPLKNNIVKILTILKNKRFSENENDNIISYFVFLEENGISITKIIRDFFVLLDGKKIQN